MCAALSSDYCSFCVLLKKDYCSFCALLRIAYVNQRGDDMRCPWPWCHQISALDLVRNNRYDSGCTRAPPGLKSSSKVSHDKNMPVGRPKGACFTTQKRPTSATSGIWSGSNSSTLGNGTPARRQKTRAAAAASSSRSSLWASCLSRVNSSATAVSICIATPTCCSKAVNAAAETGIKQRPIKQRLLCYNNLS